MSALGRSNVPSVAERRSIQLAPQAPRRPSSSARPRLPHRDSKNPLSHASPQCARLWFPGKGTRNMTPQVSGLFYSSKLQASIAWWKIPHNFASKKLFVTLVTEVSLISREPNLRFERISISRGILCKSFSSFSLLHSPPRKCSDGSSME